MIFLYPQAFWLLAGLVPAFLYFELRPFWSGEKFKHPLVDALPSHIFSWSILGRYLLVLIKVFIVFLLVVVLARPQSPSAVEEEKSKGVEIVLALDISGSMKAEDFKPKNRVQAAKEVMADFIRDLKGNDKVGLVVFAGRSFTQCPLTLDKEIVLNFLNQVEVGETVLVDGTALGDGLVNAVSVLDKDPGQSKMIILASDGVANTGVPPLDGAKLAASKGIAVYTIGIGKKGGAPLPYIDPFGQKQYVPDPKTGGLYLVEEPDEKSLGAIAEMTGGQYFRATDEKKLADIYARITKMTQQEFTQKTHMLYQDDSFRFLLAAVLLLFVYFILAEFPLKIIPA